MSVKDQPFRNAGKCGLCGEEIESTYRHEFKQCGCGNLFVDGGQDYQRFGYDPKREDGSSMLWNNMTNEWVTLKDLERDVEQMRKEKKEELKKLKAKGRKLMLPD